MSITYGLLPIAQFLVLSAGSAALGVAGLGALAEGATLLGANALQDAQSTSAKVVKCALIVLAIAAALAATMSLGCGAYLLGIVLFESSAGALAACVIAALLTLPAHWNAFRLSGLLGQQGAPREA